MIDELLANICWVLISGDILFQTGNILELNGILKSLFNCGIVVTYINDPGSLISAITPSLKIRIVIQKKEQA